MGAFFSGMKFGVYIAGAIIGFNVVYVPIKGIAKGVTKIFKEAGNDQKNSSDDVAADVSE